MMTRMSSAQMEESMMGGGIAPTIGASHFGQEKYILEQKLVETTDDKNQTSN